MGSRNYGLGTRDMASAGTLAMNAQRERGNVSYSTAATVSDRWASFVSYAKAEGVGRMERITGELVRAYGQVLAEQVRAGERSPATAQNLVSAVNTVMRSVTDWQSVSPVRDCGIEQRCAIRDGAPATLDRAMYEQARESVRDAVGERAAAIVDLCRELGLRSKEASLLNAVAAVREVQARGVVTISEGTKGGREREFSITDLRQIEALRAAAVVQGHDRSMIPKDQSWAQWREGDLRAAREVLRDATGDNLRDLRSAYACDRYEAISGHAAPCAGGVSTGDRETREQIAQELGHGRIDVVAEYVGGRG